MLDSGCRETTTAGAVDRFSGSKVQRGNLFLLAGNWCSSEPVLSWVPLDPIRKMKETADRSHDVDHARETAAPGDPLRPRRLARSRAGFLLSCTALLALLSCTLVPASCNNEIAEPPPVVYDSDRAWAHLEKIVGFGPRYSGGKGNADLQKYLQNELTALGLRPVRETFVDRTPIGPVEFANVYADVPAEPPADGSSPPMVVLVSHFDTKALQFEFQGANDSGSSTAVLLELARCLVGKKDPSPVTYRILFVDGEEALRPTWIGNDNTYGSRHHVARLVESGGIERVKACVVLDMVGDRDLQLTTELNSSPALLDVFFSAAHRIGLGDHVGGWSREINDDHLPFLAAGVPSVDLIDFEYGPYNEYWHTEEDTLEHCSAQSLGIIGRIVLAGLPELEGRILGR